MCVEDLWEYIHVKRMSRQRDSDETYVKSKSVKSRYELTRLKESKKLYATGIFCAFVTGFLCKQDLTLGK